MQHATPHTVHVEIDLVSDLSVTDTVYLHQKSPITVPLLWHINKVADIHQKYFDLAFTL